MARTYVPGYGYVDSTDTGTSGSVSPGPKRRDTGQAPRTQPTQAPAAGVASEGEHWRNRSRTAIAADGTAGSSFTPRPTEGVAFPLSGYGGFGQLGGYEFGQRMGPNPDALELFPYGVAYRTEKDAINSFLELEPQYQLWLDNLSENPLLGTSASTGRMLWERISGLAAERTAMGRPASPQQIAAEIANSIGVSPLEGRTKEIDWTGSGSSGSGSSGGGGGYSGGGSGGGGGQVSLTNPASARGLLMQTMQSVLGRDPTGNEVKTFLATLNETEMANPQTVSVEGDTVVGKGGTDPGLLAMEFAQDATDYKERQGDMYYQTFMRALAGGV